MSLAPGDDVLVAVEAHACAVLGADSGRASVSFVGVERLDVLRFGPDPNQLYRYLTLGMSRRPMADPAAAVVDDSGPRAELVLTITGQHDSVLRPLAMLAASPAVEGVVIRPGATLSAGGPLWDGSRFSAVLVGDPGDPGDPVPDLGLGPDSEPVRFLPVLPITAEEQAYKLVHGPEALTALWSAQRLDLTDPHRPAARLP
jgi:hypothetical protein